MSFINYSSREINCKIVYYGPGLCGKTTNLQYIYNKTNPETKGKLIEQGYDFDRIPAVVQYNKRDLPNAVSAEELRKVLNPRRLPEYSAVAPTGVGVFDTLKAVAKLVLTELKKGG